MKSTRLFCIAAALAAMTCVASDEIQGSAADVLSAIREKAIEEPIPDIDEIEADSEAEIEAETEAEEEAE